MLELLPPPQQSSNSNAGKVDQNVIYNYYYHYYYNYYYIIYGMLNNDSFRLLYGSSILDLTKKKKDYSKPNQANFIVQFCALVQLCYW